ncbi:hypothetical protein Bca101_044455 [Brassica carinata]
MRNSLAERSHFIAQLITKAIHKHNGNLELCNIQHMTPQTQDGTLEAWIRSLIHVKHTKYLALERFCAYRGEKACVLHLPPNIFSHPMLTSLLLSRYKFEFAHPFNNCNNLIVLKLYKIKVEVDVLNTIIASCPSLKMLVLKIFWCSQTGCLKIHNNNLKFVHLACTKIDLIEVSAALLDIFSVNDIKFASGSKIVLDAPRLLQFGQRLCHTQQSMPHIVYNISCDAQHNDVYKEESESSIDGIQKKWGYSFLGVDSCVRSVDMYNFNGLDEDQFALAASFVIQGKMLESLVIETSSLPENKKLAIDVAVAKLMKLPKGNRELIIEYI